MSWGHNSFVAKIALKLRTWMLYFLGTVRQIFNPDKLTLSQSCDPCLFHKPNDVKLLQKHSSTPSNFTNFNLPYVVGRASISQFTINCYGWKEWRPLVANAPLYYKYFTKKPSAANEFPFAFGENKTENDPTVFPVGDFEKDFRLDAVIYIYDSVKDPLRFVIPVKVRGRLVITYEEH